MLKKLALMIPAISKLREDRNRYAAETEVLSQEVAKLRSANDLLSCELKSLRCDLALRNDENLKSLRNELQSLRTDTVGLRDRIMKFESNIQVGFDDIRRENFSLAADRMIAARQYQLTTDYPIALESDDHIFPRGTRNDNTRYPRFVHAAERAIGRKLRVLELGCAGGGIVLDFLLAGHDAIGIEGSDYSAIWRRAEWATIPDRLYTADITKPFTISVDGEIQRFDLVTAWEVLEHIRDDALDGLFSNIRMHLAPEGVFCGSVATFEDRDPATGAVWHVTVKSREWWTDRITKAGFEIVDGLFSTADYPRGSGNPRSIDWDASVNPELGFHICCRIKQ